MTRDEIALQLTLKNFNPQAIQFSDEDFADDSANVKLAKAVSTFFNTVYKSLLEE